MVTLRIFNAVTDETVHEEQFDTFGEAEFVKENRMEKLESRPDYDELDYEYLGHSEDPEEEEDW